MAACLAVETSSALPSLSWRDGQNIYDITANKQSRSSDLVTVLNEFLCERGYSLDPLESIYVSKGPGNYTGLRVGLAFVQGLAFPRNVTIKTFCSLSVVAETYRQQNNICDGEATVFVDARGGQVTSCSFTWVDSKISFQSDIVCAEPEELLTSISTNSSLVGSACVAYEKLLNEKGYSSINDCSPNSQSLFSLQEQGQGDRTELLDLSPFYIRSPV